MKKKQKSLDPIDNEEQEFNQRENYGLKAQGKSNRYNKTINSEFYNSNDQSG